MFCEKTWWESLDVIDFDIWKSIKDYHFVPTHQFNSVVVNKVGDDWTEEESEKVQHCLKTKAIITITLGFVWLLCVSHCKRHIGHLSSYPWRKK